MSLSDEICVSCGLCCTTLSTVHIRPDDIECLMQGYQLTREQALAMVRRDPNDFKILMEKTAACPALGSKGGRYICHAYEHRPKICREYECYILGHAKEWLNKRKENEKVDEGNAFFSASDEETLARQVQEHIQRMRTNWLTLCVNHGNDDGFRKPDYLPQLIAILSGGEFENSFPPARPVSHAPQ